MAGHACGNSHVTYMGTMCRSFSNELMTVRIYGYEDLIFRNIITGLIQGITIETKVSVYVHSLIDIHSTSEWKAFVSIMIQWSIGLYMDAMIEYEIWVIPVSS